MLGYLLKFENVHCASICCPDNDTGISGHADTLYGVAVETYRHVGTFAGCQIPHLQRDEEGHLFAMNSKKASVMIFTNHHSTALVSTDELCLVWV